MKKTLIKISIVLITLFAVTFEVSAHFGSRGPFGGSVNCMIRNDSTVYVGTHTGGVYESTNSLLTTWRPRPVGLKSGKVNALGHTGSYLFAATDSGVYRFTGYVVNDRYWEKTSTGLPSFEITSMVAIDSITMLVGLHDHGVYKTVNKGATWDSSNTGMHHYEINGLVKAGARIIQIGHGGVWASDDNGQTWFDYNDLSTEHIEATALSYNATTDELLVFNTSGLYLLAGASTTGLPVYTSVSANIPANTEVRSITNDGANWYIATDQGVFSSPTGTVSWSNQNAGMTTMDVTAIVHVPMVNVLVSGTMEEGLFKTPATTISWTVMNNGFNNLVAHSMICKDVTVVVAATDKGVFMSNNLATTYTPVNNGLTDSLNVNDLTFYGTTLVAATQNAGVFMSADTGHTWTAFNTNLTNLSIRKVYASAGFVYIFSSAGEIFQSDMINGWTAIQAGLPMMANPTSMDFYNGNVLLGTMGDGVYTRPEAAGTWTQINLGLTNLMVTSVAVNNHNKMFAGTDGNGVFVSDLTTVNWAATSSMVIPFATLIGLDPNWVQDVKYYAGYVFASYRGGVVATSDDGLTWIEGGTQFNLPSYADLHKLSFVTTRFFATTPNNGLYSNSLAELPTVSVSEIDFNSGISFYPNPGNGNFSIRYDNSTEKTVELLVYDIMGNEVARINTPEEQIMLNAAKGAYFLKLTTNKRVVSQKFIIQ